MGNVDWANCLQDDATTTFAVSQRLPLNTPKATKNSILSIAQTNKVICVFKGYIARTAVFKARSNHLITRVTNYLQENALSAQIFQNTFAFPSPSAKVVKLLKKLSDIQFPILSDDVQVENRPPVGYQNGDVYIGQWTPSGLRHGAGKIYFANGSLFEGHFQEDWANGQGRMLNYDGSYYVGEYLENRQHGLGVLHKDSKTFYTGSWKMDMREGRGRETWKDGNCYNGDFRNNLKHGKGSFTWADGRVFEGMFRDNAVQGKGKLTYPDGKVFIGTWKNNQMHGRGVFTWPDGRKYDGEYKNDKKHGHGKFLWPSGKMYDGAWQNGKQHGEARYRKDEDDKVKLGIWANGKRVRWINENSLKLHTK